MQFLKEIKDNEYTDNFKVRQASRAILFDDNNLVPILFVARHNYHKLPGGGIKEGETRNQALVRECLEEVGCQIQVDGEIGEIIEFRSQWNLKQFSYCYYGKVTFKGKPNFTKKELNNGFQILWVSIDEAISRIKNDKTKDYEGTFIQQRDLAFLEKAKEIIR